MSNIKEFITQLTNKENELKEAEQANDNKIKEKILFEINQMINSYISSNSLSKEEINAIKAFQLMYSQQQSKDNLISQIEQKENLIARKISEKYLINKNEETKGNINNSSVLFHQSLVKEYEVLNKPLIKEISDICKNIIKEAETKFGNQFIVNHTTSSINVDKLHPSQSMELNDGWNNNPLNNKYEVVWKYIRDISKISKIKDMNMKYDTTRIKQLQNENELLRKEIGKMIPKYNEIKKKLKKAEIFKKHS